ncbi:MAG: FHA domain-containing protein [Candidatus Calescibacterium sp.]|nr:FHA domain-containing protein [Candidatus Calescibacterium sp.]MDW8132861.1 FHA domain-containing protein [Candidatus Calescibacterium sp.]
MRINVLTGPYEGNNYSFEYDIIVGREGNVDLSIPLDLAVSRKHLKLSVVGKSLVVEDLNSTNGTFLIEPGRVTKVSGKKEVNDFPAFIKIGNTVLEVLI